MGAVEVDGYEDLWPPDPALGPVAFDLTGPDAELLEGLASFFESLGERDADVLQRRLGIFGYEPQTLAEIGEAYSLSRERIRQIQNRALTQCRRKLGSSKGREPPFGVRLRFLLRSFRSYERGTALRASFPECSTDVLAAFVASAVGPRPEQVRGWLGGREAAIKTTHGRFLSQWGKGSRLIDHVVWPPELTRGDAPAVPVRFVDVDGYREFRMMGFKARSSGSKFHSPKIGREIACESIMERAAFKVLEEAPQVSLYCEQPVTIDFSYQGRKQHYYPDVAVQLDDGRVFLLEVKPMYLWADTYNLAKWDAATDWCRLKGWGFKVIHHLTDPVELLSEASDDKGLILYELTENGPVEWPALKEAWFDKGYKWRTLVANALAYRYTYQHAYRYTYQHGAGSRWKPFRLEKVGSNAWLESIHALQPKLA